MRKTITPEQSKDARSELDLSQNYVSKQTGIGRAYMSQFENDYRKLTDSQQAKLRSFYEDEGFIFQGDLGKSTFNREVEKVQESLGSLAIDGADINIKAVELTELLSSLEHIVENMDDNQSSVIQGANNSDISDTELKEVFSDFERGNAAFESYFSLDNENEIEKEGWSEERYDKVVSLMALQYMRYMAATTGKAFFKNNHLVDNVLSDGKEAKILSDMIIETIAKNTKVDSYLEDLVA
jgi:transcriptional regulator with XRE-family HTH domain